MVMERDKYYRAYVAAYVFVCVFVMLLYVYGGNISFGLAFLFNSPVFLLTILGGISQGRTFIMDEEGCTVCFWKYKKKYTWEDLITKRIEEHDFPSIIRGKNSCPYLKGAIFAPYKIHKPKAIGTSLYSLFHPLSCIYINFSLEDVNYENGRYYEIEEAVFMEKMKQWGIALEEPGKAGDKGTV